MKVLLIVFTLSITMLIASSITSAEELKAYYTRLDYEDNISGEHADIIVDVEGIGKLIFSRETSYLPYWKLGEEKIAFKEIVMRRGDGDAIHPDKFNRYSYVRIIENSSEKVVIHWRYYPNFMNTGMSDIVHEIFTITAGGNVLRVVKEATNKIHSWRGTEQKLQLNQAGIKEVFLRSKTITDNKEILVKAAAVINYKTAEPAAYWSFDEGMVGYTEFSKESISNIDCPISGPKSYWMKGVSGAALQLDGYNSGIKFPVEYSPKVAVKFTIEAWAAMAAHPFGWVPVVQQSQWKNNGYYFGINAHGQVGFHWNNSGVWKSIITEKKIDINQWVHLAVTFNEKSEKILVYINGEPEAEGKININNKPTLIHANAPLTIGLNDTPLMPRTSENYTYGQYPCITGLEGAIDEVAFYFTEFSGEQVRQSYSNFKPSKVTDNNPGFEKRTLPGHPGKVEKFGAYYTKLKYHELWDNMWRTSEWPDIVVKFDDLPTSVVFWRGTTYGPGLVTENNYWMVDQSVETGNIISYGEHMSDKQARYNHIRLIENTDARTVIHWRYSTSDVLYSFVKPYGEAGVWVDEYWTIYPDGVGIRKVNKKAISNEVQRESIDWETRPVEKIGWQDVQFLAEPGMTPDDVMNLQAVHLANLSGETATMSWADGIPKNNPLPSANIEKINFKSDYKPFLVFQDGTYINPWGNVPEGMYCHFMTWNHWPVAMISSQGKSSLFPDRATHSALCAADNAVEHGNMAMYGFTKEHVENLVPLARSWCNPAKVENIKGAESKGYMKEERAYHLEAYANSIIFRLNGSVENPVVNPCFNINNYKKKVDAEVFINGKRIDIGTGFRQGTVIGTDGNLIKIIWLKYKSDSPISIEIK